MVNLDRPQPNEKQPYDALLEVAREEFKQADTQEEVFAQANTAEADPQMKQARMLAAVERLSTAKVESSTEYFLSPFAHLLDPNPRSMKRFVNAYALQRDIAMLAGLDIIDEEKRKKMALWIIILLRWPLLEEYLLKLAIKPDVEISQEVQSLLKSKEVRDVLNGTGINNDGLDLASITEFAELRGAQSTTSTVA
jgi:hypothetical protein